ncbi:hypothetical protein GTA08_BOTSDO10321 [Botryosphaeria dothidea]|uniref:Uncharacterized protein n=1 Tax=Botryosphaeria dothidea TaxID=55169 RepID=A0A8H4IKN2_9PEZI|nr:hypothetical protein GTA08_BOTSDO10321 [Botryosphaeria dothidea]
MPSQPYMYEPPQRFSATSDTLYGFDPKADGPLMDFNRHPDSYLVTPYQSNARPFNPRTKVVIKWVRWGQLAVRILQLIGAIGLLICVICIKGTQDTEGWIIRVPAAFDILCCLYAIYHLVRPARSRTASSSASYHFFTLIIDTGLIPFYVFTAMLAKTNLSEAPGTEGRWRSFFNADESTNKILSSTWLTSVTVGGLHLVSIGVGLYLVLVFRKISRLPPDMNPLEDNLTSRRSTKHKHKTSSLSEITAPPEKRFSDMSGRPYHLHSLGGTLTATTILTTRAPPVNHAPTFQTRSTSSLVQTAPSRTNVYSRTGSMSPTKLELKDLPIKLSTKSLGGYDSMSPSSSPDRSPVRSARSMKRQSMKSDNWFVHPEAEAASDEDDEPTAAHPLVRRYSFERDDDIALYADIVNNSGPLSPLSDGEQTGHLRPEPLRMNPPTPSPKPTHTPPPPMPFQSTVGSISSEHSSGIGRALTINSSVTRTTDAWGYFPGQHAGAPVVEPAGTHSNFSSPSRSPTRNGGGKRYYGDLRAAQEGIAGRYQQKHNNADLLGARLGANGGGTTKRSMGRSPERPAYARVESSPRVVSRSGVDVDGADGNNGDLGLMRGRVVSGKMAEEGLVGVVTRRKVSGMA